MPKQRARETARTPWFLPNIFLFRKTRDHPVSTIDVGVFVGPVIQGLGYRARRGYHPPFRIEAYWALRSLEVAKLVRRDTNADWLSTEEGRGRKGIDPEEAEEIVDARKLVTDSSRKP